MAFQTLNENSQNSYGATAKNLLRAKSLPSPSCATDCSSALMFSVRGNKYGFATCCDDFNEDGELDNVIVPSPNISLSASL